MPTLRRFSQGPLFVVATSILFAGCNHGFIHDDHKPDAEMIRHFKSHKPAFVKFVERMRPDPKVMETPLKRDENRAIVCPRGIEVDEHGNIRLVATVREQYMGGTQKGYAYLRKPPTHLAPTLDGVKQESSFLVFRHIEGQWYLFLEHNS